jgi:hypothetical protein
VNLRRIGAADRGPGLAAYTAPLAALALSALEPGRSINESEQRRLRRSARPERTGRYVLLAPLPPVRKNALDELRLLNTRDHSQAPAAAPALLDLDPEYAL